MTERSRFWNGTTLGDATEAPYDASTELAAVLMALSGVGGQTAAGRVLYSFSLAPSSPGANTLRVATGEAIVVGTWYQNDANVDVNIPTPGGSTRIDRVVLRKSWASQTVRVTRIAGAEGGGAPSLTQILGTTWDFPIAQVSITTGGVMTITDQRKGITRNFTVPLTVVYAGGSHTVTALNRGIWALADNAINGTIGMAPMPEEWIQGTPITVRFRYYMESATSGNVRLDNNASILRGSGAAGIEQSFGGVTVAVPGTSQHQAERVETITTMLASMLAGDWLNLRFVRAGNDGADTASGNLNLYDVAEVEYEAFA